MDKQQILDLLNANKDRLDEFAVKALFLFGSVARGEATPESDVDLLVEFNRPVGLLADPSSYVEGSRSLVGYCRYLSLPPYFLGL